VEGGEVVAFGACAGTVSPPHASASDANDRRRIVRVFGVTIERRRYQNRRAGETRLAAGPEFE
jgi:hypothetical protein